MVQAGFVTVDPAVHRRYRPAEEPKLWNRKENCKLVKAQVLLALYKHLQIDLTWLLFGKII